MRALLLIGLALCVVAVLNQRLVFFPETGMKVHMTQAQVDRLAGTPGQKTRFVDITRDPAHVAHTTTMAAKTFPEKPRFQKQVAPFMVKIANESKALVTDHIRVLSTKWRDRKCSTPTGQEAAEWILAKFKELIASFPEERRGLFSVELYPHEGYNQQSVVAKMKGKTDEILILGGHEDSTSWSGASPGADDNASGVATVLEMFRLIGQSDFVPTKSIEFMAFACEEIGLIGSVDIAQKYKNENKNVYAMLNWDMTGYTPDNTVAVISSYASPSLNKFAVECLKTYCRIKFVEKKLGGYLSDHYSFTKQGWHSMWVWEKTINPAIHSSVDTLDKLNMNNAMEYLKLCMAMTYELTAQ